MYQPLSCPNLYIHNSKVQHFPNTKRSLHSYHSQSRKQEESKGLSSKADRYPNHQHSPSLYSNYSHRCPSNLPNHQHPMPPRAATGQRLYQANQLRHHPFHQQDHQNPRPCSKPYLFSSERRKFKLLYPTSQLHPTPLYPRPTHPTFTKPNPKPKLSTDSCRLCTKAIRSEARYNRIPPSQHPLHHRRRLQPRQQLPKGVEDYRAGEYRNRHR